MSGSCPVPSKSRRPWRASCPVSHSNKTGVPGARKATENVETSPRCTYGSWFHRRWRTDSSPCRRWCRTGLSTPCSRAGWWRSRRCRSCSAHPDTTARRSETELQRTCGGSAMSEVLLVFARRICYSWEFAGCMTVVLLYNCSCWTASGVAWFGMFWLFGATNISRTTILFQTSPARSILQICRVSLQGIHAFSVTCSLGCSVVS